MKHTANQLTLTLFALCFWTFSSGQNLTPKVLTEIQKTADFLSVTSSLLEKGFKQVVGLSAEAGVTEARWYFQPFTESGEKISSYLIKTVDSSQKAKTVFILYNPFYYKEFIKNLIDARFRFRGTKYLEGQVYYLFKNKRYTFMTTERTGSDKLKAFQIQLQTN